MRSQNERVLEYMKEHNGITSLQAYDKLGVTRLSARIKDLRTAGHIIFADRIEVFNRYGDSCTVNLYTWKGKKND